jgi:predicted amidohydrolase
MSRKLRVGAAQIGPIFREESRENIIDRHIALLEDAARRNVDVILYPECSLTTWFPTLQLDDSEVDLYYEKTMPNPSVQPLFDRAKELEIAFCLGYAELDGDNHFNSSILVGKDGKIIGKYRKTHVEPDFTPGDSGFSVWPALGGYVGIGICYDRRWPEFWRVMGMLGAEVVFIPFCSLGSRHLAEFHHLLCLQAGAFFNGTWVIASSHTGEEVEGHPHLGVSAIVSPLGEIISRSYTCEDELIEATIDLDETKKARFAPRAPTFALDRRPELYKMITDPNWDGVHT